MSIPLIIILVIVVVLVVAVIGLYNNLVKLRNMAMPPTKAARSRRLPRLAPPS